VDWHEYVFLGKNRPVVEHKPDDPPFFLMLGPFLTEQLRTQIMHVLVDAVGDGEYAQEAWGLVVDHYDREMGTRNLGLDPRHGPQWAVGQFLTVTDDVTDLDLTALALIVAEEISNHMSRADIGLLRQRIAPAEAVERVNRFLREANVHYQFEAYRWVDVTSSYAYKEVIRPALDALDRPGFAGALEEFKSALDHGRAGRTKEAATDATKALESTVKCICKERGWSYPDSAPAQRLFQVMVEHGILEDWMEGGFMGVAIIRNKATAHGQGTHPRPLPRHLADLAINLASSQIIALIAAHDALGPS
jgi:hypothetical protein